MKSCCTKYGHLPKLSEIYADESSCRTLEINGPYPEGTKAIFIEIKPGLTLKNKDMTYIRPSDSNNTSLPQWVREIIKIPGFVEISQYTNHIGRIQFCLCRYNDRHILAQEIFCILRKYYDNPCHTKNECCNYCNRCFREQCC